jgi:ubiquitin-like 1-activating enzyme E1 B
MITIQEAKEPLADKPIKGLVDEAPSIPRKPKADPSPESNGVSQANGNHSVAEASTNELKRSRADDADLPQAKKAKLSSAAGDEVIQVDADGEGPATGPIVLD